MFYISHIDSTGYDLPAELPQECIDDCSAPGSVDESVAHWVSALDFGAIPAGTRNYLRATGAWDAEELDDHDANLQRLLWLICCDMREEQRGSWRESITQDEGNQA